MKNIRLITALLFAISAPSFAQVKPAQPATGAQVAPQQAAPQQGTPAQAQGGAQPPQPKSNLGKQAVSPPSLQPAACSTKLPPPWVSAQSDSADS